MGSLVTDTEPTEAEKAFLSKSPVIQKFSKCQDLKDNSKKSFILEPIKLDNYGPATKVGDE